MQFLVENWPKNNVSRRSILCMSLHVTYVTDVTDITDIINSKHLLPRRTVFLLNLILRVSPKQAVQSVSNELLGYHGMSYEGMVCSTQYLRG